MQDDLKQWENQRPANPDQPSEQVCRPETAYGAGPPFAPAGVVEQVHWIPLEVREYQSERWDGLA